MFSIFQKHFTSNQSDRHPARKINPNESTSNRDLAIYFNYETFYCVLCAEQCEPGNGVMLQQCCHPVCTPCLITVIKRNTDVEIRCPYSRTLNECQGVMLHCEIRSLASEEEFENFVDLSLKVGVGSVYVNMKENAQIFFFRSISQQLLMN